MRSTLPSLRSAALALLVTAALASAALLACSNDSDAPHDAPVDSGQPVDTGADSGTPADAGSDTLGSDALSSDALSSDALSSDAPDAIDAAETVPECYTNPKTHYEIINACTDAARVDKHPSGLPFLPDGALPPPP